MPAMHGIPMLMGGFLHPGVRIEGRTQGAWRDTMQEQRLQPGGFGASLWLRPSTAVSRSLPGGPQLGALIQQGW